MSDRAHESCQSACGEDVAGIEDALPPGPVHDAVGREDADRSCGRSNPRRKQQRSQDAWKRSEVDLLLGADLDRIPFGEQYRYGAGRNQCPAPWVNWREATVDRGDRAKTDAGQRDSNDDRLQPRRQAGEGRDQSPAQLVGTSSVRVTTRPPFPSPPLLTRYR